MQFEYIVAELTLTCAKLSVQCLSVIEGSIFCYFIFVFPPNVFDPEQTAGFMKIVQPPHFV